MADIPRAKQLCVQFINEMAENRTGKDDAGVARKILADLATYGEVLPRHRQRLSWWCHTNGSVFKRGIRLAQEISMALYDRVIPREER